MKLFLMIFITVCFFGCADNDTTNNQTQTNTDSVALKAIDSSAILNDSTLLPSNSKTTTVTH